MSWHYLQEQEEGCLLVTSTVGAPGVPLKSRNTPEKFYYTDNKMDALTASRFGTTLTPLKESPGQGISTSLPAASLAKTYPQQVKVQELPESVRAFGKNISESLTKLGLSLSSRKTLRSCEAVDSAPFSKTLTSWGMTAAGVCWELGTSAVPISVTECGSWATSDNLSATARGATNERLERNRKAIAAGTMRYPTPLCSDLKIKTYPSDAVRHTHQLTAIIGGPLNPRWIEWLMGWPMNHTQTT